MTQLRLTSLLVVLLFAISSCQKELISTSGDTPVKTAITKSGDSLYYTQFAYDNQNRITVIVDSTNGGSHRKRELSYDGQGRLISFTDSLLGSLKLSFSFLYDANGRIIQKLGTFTSVPGNPFRNTYAYDPQGRLIADTTYDYWTGSIFEYVTYSYNANNNIVETKTFNSAGALQTTMQAQYDTKPNPYNQWGLILYLVGNNSGNLNRNNCLMESYHDGTTITYEYQYNSEGLPLKFTETDNTDPLVIYHELFY